MKVIAHSQCEVPGKVVRYYARVLMDNGTTTEFASATPLKDSEWLDKATQYVAAIEASKPTAKAVVEDEIRQMESHYAAATTEMTKLTVKEQADVKAASPMLATLTAKPVEVKP